MRRVARDDIVGGLALGEVLDDVRLPRRHVEHVALLDDDPGKRSLRVMGIPVAGNRDKMAEVVQRYRANTVLIAIPSAGAAASISRSIKCIASGRPAPR